GEVGSGVPSQLQHLVTQTSLVFGTTEFTNYNFDASSLTAGLADTIPVPPSGPARPTTSRTTWGATCSAAPFPRDCSSFQSSPTTRSPNEASHRWIGA